MPARRAAWPPRMLSRHVRLRKVLRCSFVSLRFASPFVSLRLLRARGMELLAWQTTPAVAACTNCVAGARSGACNLGRHVDKSCRLSRAERRTARSPPCSRVTTARCAHTRRVCGSTASLLAACLLFTVSCAQADTRRNPLSQPGSLGAGVAKLSVTGRALVAASPTVMHDIAVVVGYVQFWALNVRTGRMLRSCAPRAAGRVRPPALGLARLRRRPLAGLRRWRRCR